MNRVFATILCLLATAAMADEVRRSTDASEDGLVTISNTAGSIEVKGWSRKQVDVSADLGRGVEELLVERDGNDVRVLVKTPRGRSHRSSSDLVVRVPENSSIKVIGVSADITVENVLGVQQLQSVSGDIETDAFGADIDIQTVSGDLDIDGDGRDMRTTASTVSGDVELQDLRGDVEASTVSGDIVITEGSFDHASLNTTSGDIVYHAAVRAKGRLDVSTINGDVDIELAGKVSARFDIETFNGDVRNCFGPDAVRTSRHAPGSELTFTEGGGTARVTVRTLNGDLRLCKD
jgi:DUF4097 and DUF4098 domain-containing protein YvlB